MELTLTDISTAETEERFGPTTGDLDTGRFQPPFVLGFDPASEIAEIAAMMEDEEDPFAEDGLLAA